MEMKALDKRMMNNLHILNNKLENSIKESRQENPTIKQEVRNNFKELNDKFSQLSIEVKEQIDKQVQEGIEGVKKEMTEKLDYCHSKILQITE